MNTTVTAVVAAQRVADMHRAAQAHERARQAAPAPAPTGTRRRPWFVVHGLRRRAALSLRGRWNSLWPRSHSARSSPQARGASPSA
jgi:hypothetical protein